MKTKFIIIISALFIIAWPVLMQSQPITTTAGSPSECPGEIVVPLTVTNCNGAGAISLVLYYDVGILTYLNYENLHPDLTSGLLIVNQVDDKVIISWASTNPADIGNGTIMHIRFSGVTGSSNLTWDTQTPGNCEYSDADGNILPSSYANGTATVYQVPEILGHPDDINALVGDNVSLSVNAIATGISRLWYRSTDGGTNWFSTGATSATLNVYDITLDMDGYLYRCEISGTCSPDAISDEAELTVIQPLITSYDVQNVCPGNITIPILTSNFTDVASLSLTFSYNTSTLTYSGYQNINSLLPGNFVCNEVGGMVYMTWSTTSPVTFGTDTTLVEILFAETAGSSNLTWDLTTPGNCEYIYLNTEEIVSVFENNSFTIYGLPEIVSQPVDKLIPENTNTSFSITATGSGLSYQWQLSTNDGGLWTDLANIGYYSGTTSATLNISGAQLSLSGHWYRCIVSGYCIPEAISNHAELLVLPRITVIGGNVSDCPGTITVPIDVTHFIDVASFSLTLGFNESVLTYDGYQSLHNNLSGGNFVANETGGKIYLTWTSTIPATIGDDLLLELLFTGITGNTNLDWDNEVMGNCEFSDIEGNIIFDNYTNGNIVVYQPPLITGDPTNQTAPEGTGTSFSVSATGTGLGYQWQESINGGGLWNNISNIAPYSGTNTATMQINPVDQTMDNYQYRCRVSGICPELVYSGSAILNVIPPVIQTSAGDISNSCTGNITVPIGVGNCNNVGAISLTLDYDPGVLTFEGFESPNSELATGMLIVHSTGTQVKLSWASSNPADIGSGILIYFNFKTNAGTSTTLTWDTQTPGNCEYSDPLGNIFATSFYNGDISISPNALVVDAGSDVVISAGGSTQMNGSAVGGTTPYNIAWTPTEYLTDPYISNPVADPPNTITYTMTVVDDLGCIGSDEMTVTVTSSGINVNLKAFLEGPFGTTEMSSLLNSNNHLPIDQPYVGPPWNYLGGEYVTSIPNTDIVDWVLVELRETSGAVSTATTGKRIARQAGFILKNGNIVSTDGSGLLYFDVNITQNLYAIIWHRNHLGIMSSVSLTETGGIFSWDFTTGPGQAYGTNAQKNLGGGKYGMYAGDANANGTIETADKNTVWVPQVGKRGYWPSDFDMDGQVKNQDKNDIWIENNNTSSQIPN